VNKLMTDRNDKAQVIGQEDKGPDYVPSTPVVSEGQGAIHGVDPASAAILQEQGKDPVKDRDTLKPPTTVRAQYEGKVPLEEGYTAQDPKDVRDRSGKEIKNRPVPPTPTSRLRQEGKKGSNKK
jgi:hypothetical protein